MNVAEEFIVEAFQKITDQLPQMAVRYAYDEDVDFHIVEVAPEEVRRGNEAYMKFESQFWKDFYIQFPEEELIIASPCPTHNMTNLIYEKNDTGIVMEMLCKP